ncbi:MAG TPA: serine hydrolase [Candidatus Limnocylindria bacterium]|nr:serine hydrolase [Candidatus Limnocylindria bacterium]
MSLRAQRLWGALLLIVLTALPTTTVTRIAEAQSSSGPSVQKRTITRSTAKRKVRRRVRRAPPGGVWARNAIVMDPATGEILYEKNSSSAVPIASLTKLMTSLVFLEQSPDLEREVEVTQIELSGAGRTKLRSGERVRLDDLLHMSLMVSDNAATRVLVRESGLGTEDFLARMNSKTVEIGLARTRFVEFTGLDERNVSTAADCARLLRAAAEHPVVQKISTTRTHEFRSATRQHLFGNTNRLVYGRYEVLGGKTGFINEAGYCLATWVRTQGRDMIAVVLGAPTAATRFADVTRLVQRTTTPAVTATH